MNSNPQWQRWSGIMKCYPFEEKRLAKWTPPFIVQIKYDGDRCRNVPAQDTSLLLTSEENVFFSVPHINEQLVENRFHTIPLDGELYNHQIYLEGGWELIHSICSRTVNIHPRHKEMEFWIVDIKVPDISQRERIQYISRLSEQCPRNVKIAPFWMCETLDEIKRTYDWIIGLGYEGIIVRNMFGAYEEKRSTMIMKFKPKKKDVYRIVGFNEEISKDGIPKDRLGSLVLSSQTGDTFAVSAGLNDDTRERYWDMREMLIGLDAVVHYQHMTNKQIPKGSFNLEVLFQ